MILETVSHDRGNATAAPSKTGKLHRFNHLDALDQNAFWQYALAPRRCRQLGQRKTIKRQFFDRSFHRLNRTAVDISRTG
jgi:hypothetical protein